MNNNEIKFEIGNQLEWNGSVPMIRIKNITNGITGYLMPFRHSFFQVSGSPKGEGDYGSGDHKAYRIKEIIQYEDNPKYMLKMEMVKCLNNYLDTRYGDVGCNAAFTLDYIPWFTEGMQTFTIPLRVKKGKAPFDMYYRLEDMPLIDELVEETFKLIVDYYKLKVS